MTSKNKIKNPLKLKPRAFPSRALKLTIGYNT